MELPKSYEPAKYEADIYKMWEDSGAFKPSSNPAAKPFSIIMPPPNANGNIHVGTAMFTLEDIMIRYHRMKGDATLWLPGTDHAGIETQVVFERELAKEGKDRFDFGPEKFYAAMMAYVKEKQSTIIGELKSMGFSADWSRLKFTLDREIVGTVYGTFKQLHDDGLIYRGNRIVNWCTRCLSSFADIEVKYVDRDDAIYTLDYGSVKIATTRPETIFADSAIAINPKDAENAMLVGQIATIPLINRQISIIADEHVDPKFGTGALKVTPGHDPNDFEIGQRHDLPQISVINLDGQMINVPEELLGLTVEQARAKTIELLQESGSLLKTTPIHHSVGTHGRCGIVIEPLITEQWWLKVEPLIQPAVQAIKSGEIKIIPASSTKTALNWLGNLHDWNISRQIWWGIRIPVYYKTSTDPEKDIYILAETEAEAAAYYGKGNYRAETDTFDTWFSSGQWPFATLGMPNSPDFEQFYPTSVMETGRDILFLWVTRMIMLGLYRTGKVPFKTVYLHGMVNDEHGKKMSKSKGNVINPLAITDKYGTDALRLALTIGITPGNDGALGEKKIEGYRNFCNKLWNVARFIIDRVEGESVDKSSPHPTPSTLTPNPSSLADQWILNKLAQAVADVTRYIERYKFSEAGAAVYSLLWDDFADWYIEASKAELNLSVLMYGLETILKLAHPFAPFVTEAIWQNLPNKQGNLITAPWPQKGQTYAPEAKQFEQVKNIVTELRVLSKELRVSKPKLLYKSAQFKAIEPVVARLAGLSSSEQVQKGRGLALTTTSFDVWLDVPAEVISGYLTKLQAEKADKEHYIAQQTALLANERFMASASPQVKQQKLDSQAEAQLLLSKLDAQIQAIQTTQI